MKITKFRIKNYKSIKDSGYCYLDDKVTILAGKNEAGKTVILEALEDFNIDNSIQKGAIPIQDETKTPEIRISISLNKEEYQKIKEKFKTVSKKEIALEIVNVYIGNDYILTEESLSEIKPTFGLIEEKKEKVKGIIDLINEKEENIQFNIDLLERPRELDSQLKSYHPGFIESLDKKGQKKMNQKIEELKAMVKELSDLCIFRDEITEFVKQNFLPNFILFKTFEDILPSQISISEAPNNSLIKDLSLISDLDFDTIRPETPPRSREMHKDKVNLKFSEDYERFWTQDHSNLRISLDSENIYFWIEEGEQLYPPEMRSKGKQWHLAYYIRVTARSLEEKRNVILIDEPGLFLHAKAQKDILRKLEECSQRTQLIYTTHSPYLIPSDRLDRVRLVMRPDEGFTTIEKITASADKETLTPILTAIGEDLSVGIRADKKNSIVVEGYSDYLYMNVFKRLLNIEEEINLIPATGGDSPIYVGSILFGWGLDPIFVLDNDKQGKKVRGKLMKRLSISEERIILVPEKDEGSIEKLFSDEDFRELVSPEDAEQGKVLKAHIFSQKVEKNEIEFSSFHEETIENFKSLFSKLEMLIKKPFEMTAEGNLSKQAAVPPPEGNKPRTQQSTYDVFGGDAPPDSM
jgi:predicted ATP-dependent endonuclease of OLD family